MRGIILSFFRVFCVILFSFFLFLRDNLLMFWLFLELGALSLIPSFFLYIKTKALSRLFSYIVVSGISSSLIISGILFEGYSILLMLGFLMKFGVFPFFGWVYSVFLGSKWLVIWALSRVLKVSFMFFPFFLRAGLRVSQVMLAFCMLKFVLVSFFFWLFTFSWVYYWCHVVISSSSAFLAMSVEGSGDLLLYLFVYYVFWVTCVVGLLSYYEGGFCFNSVFLAVFFLVSFPGSISLFYKLLVRAYIFSCGFLVFLSWVIYKISEQLFLVKNLVSIRMPRGE